METINLGVDDGLPPVDWNVYRIEPRSATVVLGTEPGGLTRFRF